MTTSPSARSCGVSAPADHQTTLSLMVSSLASARSTPSGSREHVVEILLGDAVADQRPLKVLLGPLLEAALAGEVLEVEDVADVVGHLATPLCDVGAIAEGSREDDLRDVALVDQAVAEIVGRGGAIVPRREHRIGVDHRRQPFVAEPLRVRSLDVHQVPGDVAGLELGAQLRGRLVRALVPGELGAGQRRIGLGVGFLLRDSGRRRPRTRRSSCRRSSRTAAGPERRPRPAGSRRRRRRVAVVGSFDSPCGSSRLSFGFAAARRGRAAVVRRRRAPGSPRSSSRPWWRRRPAASGWPGCLAP